MPDFPQDKIAYSCGRGSGRTTRQIQSAPIGALFIVANETERRYIKSMIIGLKREDLRVETVEWFRLLRFKGLELPAIIVDHYVYELATAPSQSMREFMIVLHQEIQRINRR